MAAKGPQHPLDYALPDTCNLRESKRKPDIDYDPTGYYARKEKHRAEMLPYVGACIVISIVLVIIAAVTQ
ncbi:MAG: hypothetical protein KAI80_04625 [Hyphomicrobiaceae bacterium]|nr:hypothetical protein [Hyphomicrobiaceae bacterium]